MLSRILLYICLFILPVTGMADDGAWSGNVALEWRGFLHAPLDEEQHGNNAALSFQPEYYRAWNNGQQAFRFTPLSCSMRMTHNVRTLS